MVCIGGGYTSSVGVVRVSGDMGLGDDGMAMGVMLIGRLGDAGSMGVVALLAWVAMEGGR